MSRDLRTDTLRQAYRAGVFPWPIDGVSAIPWFCPPERAILDFADLHLPRSLKRRRNQTSWSFSVDRDFRGVILACAEQPRPGQVGTWITHEMIEAYSELHRQGDAHSVEVWNPEGDLIGGIYGVDAGGAFSAESMFHRESDASKLALLHLIDHLRARGLDWIDIQMLTPHLERLGAKEISRDRFLSRLHQTQVKELKLFEASASEA